MRSLIFLLCVLGLVLVAGALVLIERKPAALLPPRTDVADGERIAAIAKRARRVADAGLAPATLSLTAPELTSLAAYAARGMHGLRFTARPTARGLHLGFTARLPATPLGRYINGAATLAPSSSGLRFENIRLGRLALSPKAGLAIARLLAGDAVITALRGLSADSKGVTLRLAVTPALKARLKSRLPLLTLDVEGNALKIYQTRLEDIARRRAPRSLAGYLTPLFALARQRSQGGDAAAENRAALIALAVNFGDEHLRDMAPALARPSGLLWARSQRTILGGRNDLMRHFVVSAGLTLTTGRSMADALGELKEISDATAGGTGFSFADLAADRAGIRFAQTAVDPQGAPHLQALLANQGKNGERLFFPATGDLPEALSRDAFKARFGSIHAPSFIALVERIDRRIAALPAYQE
jgi:hypothetical protein